MTPETRQTRNRSDWERIRQRVKLATFTGRSIAQMVADRIEFVHKFPVANGLDKRTTVY